LPSLNSIADDTLHQLYGSNVMLFISFTDFKHLGNVKGLCVLPSSCPNSHGSFSQSICMLLKSFSPV
jgi:hypothetical protein